MNKTTLFNLLHERMTEKEIIDCITNYDNKYIELEKKIEQLKEERKTLYKYTPEKGFELVGDEDA